MKFAFFVHYFPPLNSTGAKRVEAFSKYLVRAGHEVVIVSTRKSTVDGPLTEQVPERVRLYEIDALGRRRPSTVAAGSAAQGGAEAVASIHWSRRLKQYLARTIGQLPDPRVPFALALASPMLDRGLAADLASADVFISSFPPWPAHLAALIAKRRWARPWIIDYRDQFSGNHIMGGGRIADQLELWVDRFLVSGADVVTVISEPMRQYYMAFHPDVRTIENGYDGELLDAVRQRIGPDMPRASAGSRVIRYMGTITRDRIPVRLFEGLRRMRSSGNVEAAPFVVEFYGDSRLLQAAVDQDYPDLRTMLRFLPPVPYMESLEKMLTADGLLFVETSDRSNLSAQGVLTTKLFEYIAVARPIVAEIAPESLAAQYIRRASSQHVVSLDPDDLVAGIQRLRELLDFDRAFVESLSRRAKTEQLEAVALELARSRA